MVVDYRSQNRVTVRKFFLTPNSDYIKTTVACNKFVSVGDFMGRFNQVDNEEETRKKMPSSPQEGVGFLGPRLWTKQWSR